MRITTKIVWDADWNVLEHEYFEYSGEVLELKDHGQDAAAAQQKRDNALQDQQLARQNAVQDQIKGATSHFVENGGEGFTPEEIAAMRSTMMNGVAANYQTAGKSVRSALLARGAGGGDQPVGGDYTKGITGLESGLANESAEGQLGITRANAQQRLSNMFNSFNALNGVASTDAGNVGVFGSGANNALNQYVAAKSIPGFSEVFGNAFGGALGAGLGGAASGGVPGLKGLGCWIAEAIYGKNDYRTHVLRHWLNNVWAKESVIGALVMKFYLKFGVRISQSRHCKLLKPLFEIGLNHAIPEVR